jgi:hypothetical protein
MANTQEKIKNRLKSLNEIDDIEVVATDEYGQIEISHRLHHTADFKFKWIEDDHYVGYFVDGDGNESQAIVSIWTAIEAIKFVALYTTLIELRAKRQANA